MREISFPAFGDRKAPEVGLLLLDSYSALLLGEGITTLGANVAFIGVILLLLL